MANRKFKLGWGNEKNIQSALDRNLLDGGDLLITKDSGRLGFINPDDKTVLYIKSQLETFNSIDEANEYASTNNRAYAGELISVKVDGNIKTYRLQPTTSGYVIEDIDANLETKQYVQVVDTLPESGQEEGVIYIVNNTGQVWTGNQWKLIFEDVTSLKEEIQNAAPLESPEFTGDVKINGKSVASEDYVQVAIEEMKNYVDTSLTLVDF